MRIAEITRVTKETDIKLSILLDGNGEHNIKTGVGFFDHMLSAFATHGEFDLLISAKGDIEVDCHHTIEDVGIVLGQAFAKALEDKSGIARFGSCYIPMDEALGFVSLDISARPFLVFKCDFKDQFIGTMDTQMIEEFFRAFAYNAGITLHVATIYGMNDHHRCEAIFKALAHALKLAIVKSSNSKTLSSKGVI